MYIVEVSPLLKAANLESLSYYSPVAYEPGTLLTIPVRNKEVTGFVIVSRPVSAARAAVRAATFSLRKLPEQTNPRPLSRPLSLTVSELAKSTPASFGSILFSLLPSQVLEGEVEPPFFEMAKEVEESFVSVLTSIKSERWLAYKRRIREAFVHRGSVVFVSPTFEGVLQAYDELTTGIIDRSIILGPLPKKAWRTAYNKSLDLSEAKLILATPNYAFLDRPDITDVIIDNAGSSFFRSRTRPYLDKKEALIIHSKIAGRRVLLGDLVHKSEDEYRRRQEVYRTEDEELHRVNLPSQFRIIAPKEKPTPEAPFQLIGKPLLDALRLVIKEKRNAFVYSARRGLAPVVACGDCGYIFRCPDSGAPYSLLRTVKNGEEQRWFLSSVSGRRVRAADTCPECGSWRLRERGIGIQQIEDFLKENLPPEKIFVLDHSSAPTPKKARGIVADFYATKGAILLGTSLAVTYLEKPVAVSAVTSMDALRATPTWRIDEDALSLLLRLREMTDDKMFIQSRLDSDNLLEFARSGQISDFFDEELRLRQELHYPPFYKLIHLTLAGTVDAVRLLESQITETLTPFGFAFYSAPSSVPSKTIRYGLCRIPASSWPKTDLLEVLKNLPPSVKVEIDPPRIV